MSRVDAKTNPLTKGLTQNLFKIPFTRDKSIKFDGTDDFVDTGFQPDFIHTGATISFWANMVNFSGNQALGCFSSGKQFYVGFQDAKASFALQATGKSSTDISAHIAVNTWHHIVLVADGGTATYYVDGVARDTHSYTPAASANPDTNFFIGAIPNGSGGITYMMEGSVDEVAVFSSAFTAREVDALYNNGQPTNLSSYSTLEAWYRMGEGKLGTKSDGDSNILFQGLPTTFGSELITNGDFSSSSGWSLDSNASVSGGKLVLASSTGLSYQSIDLDNGAAYEVTFTIENFSTGTVKPYLNGTNGTVRSANGTYKEIVLAGSANTLVGINPSGTMDIDNFSVKKLTNVGTINGARIQADRPQELITNGTYDTDTTGWTAHSYSSTTALSVVSGKLRVTSSTSYGFAYQGFPTRVGGVYSYTVEGTKGTSPNWDAFFGTHFNGAQNVSAVAQGGSDSQGTTGTVSGTFTATATTTFITLRSRNEGSVTDAFTDFDNVSVKEVTESVPKKTQNLPSAGSAKSLSFDGTDDYVDCGTGLGNALGDDYANSLTVSIWFKADTTSGNDGLFNIGDFSSSQGEFQISLQSNNIYYTLNNNGFVRHFSFTDTDNWNHIVVVYAVGDATNSKVYMNGSEQATSQSGSLPSSTDLDFAGLKTIIGAYYATNHPFHGSIDEVAVWNEALDSDAIKAIYNAGQPTPVTTKTGAYDIYRDNLKAYYRMGDATNPAADGTNNLLFDQTSPGVGSERISDGGFDDPSAWNTSIGDTVIEDGVGKFPSTTNSFIIKFSAVPSSTVATYRLTYDIVSTNGNTLSLAGGSSAFPTQALPSSLGTHTVFVTSNGAQAHLQFNNGASFVGSIDNVSLREVNGHTGTISGATIQTEAPKAIYALPPVANTKSIDFDGTNDHLVTQVDSVAQPNNESRYYSWWSKSSDSGAQYMWDHGAFTIGGFGFNISVGRPLLYMSASVFRYFEANTLCDDGAWHHWVVRIKYNDITGCELWCDGVKQGVSADGNTGSMNTYTSGIKIAKAGGAYFNGSIDEFSIHEELDEEAIRALFNRGRPIDISKSQGAYDLSDKALHYWRMGDATSPAADGTDEIIFQGFSAESDELVTNGGFNTDSNWSKGSGWTINNGTAIHTGGGSYLSQDIMVAGRTYEMSFDIISLTDPSSDFVQPYFNQSPALGLFRAVGRHTVVATAVEGTLGAALRATGDITVDNVSVKQVRGQYIGPELVKADADLYQTNPWLTNGTVATYPSGTAARFTNPASGGNAGGGSIRLNSNATLGALTSDLETGCVYKLQFNFLTDDSDAFPRYYDGSSYTNLPAGSGLKVHYFAASGSSNALINCQNLSANKFVQYSGLSLTKVGGAAVLTNMDSASDIQTDTPY